MYNKATEFCRLICFVAKESFSHSRTPIYKNGRRNNEKMKNCGGNAKFSIYIMCNLKKYRTFAAAN